MGQVATSRGRSSAVQVTDQQKRRRTLFAACFGFFVDMYDVYLPVIALTPALAYFLPASVSTSTKATIAYTVLAASLLGRPIGAVIFGHLGDRIGRRRVTIIATLGFTICTGVIAMLPGYGTLGLGAVGILVFLRLLDGVFLGGEYTGANPLAMEYAPRNKRGLYGSLINTGYPAALAVITIVTMVTLKIFPVKTDSGASYVEWGWRVPFLIGFLMSLAMLIYYIRSVPESELWLKAPKPDAPLKQLFTGEQSRRLLQVLVVMTGAWLTLDAVAGTLPALLKTVLGVSTGYTNVVILVGSIVGVLMFPITGILGQRHGRRTVLMVLGVLNVVVTPPLFVLLAAGGYDNFTTLLLLSLPIQVLTLMIWAIVTAYITESFPTSVRASGYGIGYSLASVLPAFYSYYMLGLGHVMPYRYTQVVLLALGGAFLLFGAMAGPDRRHVDMAESA